jgi:hypothetical protein
MAATTFASPSPAFRGSRWEVAYGLGAGCRRPHMARRRPQTAWQFSCCLQSTEPHARPRQAAHVPCPCPRASSDLALLATYLRSEICRYLAPWIIWDCLATLERTRDGNQVAPLTREHPRRRYTPVDYPWAFPNSCLDHVDRIFHRFKNTGGRAGTRTHSGHMGHTGTQITPSNLFHR